MKTWKTIIASFALICTLSCTKNNRIELPITEKNGYGPFKSSLAGISPYAEDKNNPWTKTHLNVSGIPENWTDIKQGDINTNIYQAVYQNYVLGNITKERYESLQESWNWVPDTSNLSKEPIKCKIAFAFGPDSTGKTQMVVDANNNRDFSDDKIFTPLEFNPQKNHNKDSLAMENAITITYERFIDNEITTVDAPLFIIHMPQYNMFMCNFPQYGIAQLNGEKIVICPDNFTNLSYNNPGISLVSDTLAKGDKINRENVIAKDEYIKIKDQIYKNIGVNRNKNVLVLEKANSPQHELYSTQVGYKPIPFKEEDFMTNSMISLDDLKGKYVLLDFWAVWCGPCIQEIPNLKALYEKTDTSEFEIIGIAGDSPPDDLTKIIERDSINWPQILSNDTNQIKEEYGIHGYPTTFLINPEGIIVAKNLRGKELEDKLLTLMDKQ